VDVPIAGAIDVLDHAGMGVPRSTAQVDFFYPV
jgi:hypothetical protein